MKPGDLPTKAILLICNVISFDKYSIFLNLIRTLFTVSEGQKIRCGLESRSD